MFLLALAIAFAAAAVLAPDTRLGSACRKSMIDAPARALADRPLVAVAHLIAMIAVVAFVVGAPELTALVGVADLSAYIELAAFVAVLGAVRTVQGLGLYARPGAAAAARRIRSIWSGRARPRGRAVRQRPARRPPAGGDSADPWGVLQPA